MSHFKRRKEERIIPSRALNLSASTVLDGTRDQILVNGPAFSGGFVPDTKSVDMSTQEWLGSATGNIGIANVWSFGVWTQVKNPPGQASIFAIGTSADSTSGIFLAWDFGFSQYKVTIYDDGSLTDKLYRINETVPPIGDWIHIGATWNGTNLNLYQNGVLANVTKVNDNALNQLDESHRIVSFTHFAPVSQGDQRMHSAAIWDVELSASAMSSVYNNGAGDQTDLSIDFGNYASSANLQHWYRLGLNAAPNIGQDFGVGSPLRPVTSMGGDTTDDADVFTDAPSTGSGGLVTVTLPAAADHDGLEITIKDDAGNAADGTITIDTTGGDTINNSSTDTIVDAFQAKTYVSDGVSNWTLTGSNALSGQGQTGAVGSTGETGATGLTGSTGETGPTGPGAADFSGALVSKNTQTLTTGIVTDLTWDTENYDVGGWFATPGDIEFTVPAGVSRVKVTSQARWETQTGGRRDLSIAIDTGGGYTSFPGKGFGRDEGISGIQDYSFAQSAVVDVSPGDKFKVTGFQDGAATLDVESSASTWFSIEAVPGGVQGETGEVGPTGPTGDLGETGPTGPGVADFSGALVSKTSGDQTLTTGINADVIFDTEVYDVGGWYDDGGDETIFTVPAGISRVRLACNVRFSTPVSTGERRTRILKNGVNVVGTGTLVTPGNGAAVSPQHFVSTAVIDVVPGDEFQVSAFQNSGVGVDVVAAAGNTWFSIESVPGGMQGETGATGATGDGFVDLTGLREAHSAAVLGDSIVGDEYCLVQYLPFAANLLEIHGEIGSTGNVEVDINIDGVPVGNMVGATFTSVGESYTGTTSNNAPTGAKITADVVGATLDPDGLCLTLVTERIGGGGTTTNWKGAQVRRTTNQVIPNVTTAEMSWDTEVYDVGGFFDIGSPTRLTIPAGINRVRLTANVNWETDVTVGQRQMNILKNGAAFFGGRFASRIDTSGPYIDNAISGIIEVVPGDYFELQVVHAAGNDLDIVTGTGTWFQIEAVQGNIQGPTGETGATGATGEAGATGPAGETQAPVGPDQFAIDFDGVTESMASLETDTGIANTWTLMVTPKFEDAGFNENLIVVAPDSGNVNRIEIRHAGNISGDPIILNLWDSAGTAFKSIQFANEDDIGLWQQLVVTWTGTTLAVYKNGSVLTPTSSPTDDPGTMTNTNRRIRISDGTGVQNPFDGRVHSAAFWNSVLTAGEITQIYDSGNGPAFFNLQSDTGSYTSSADLIHWYRLATNTSILGEDTQGSLDLDQLTAITSADVVNDFPNQTQDGADGADGATGPTGPTGPTGVFDSTAVSTTVGATVNSTTTLAIDSDNESRLALALDGTQQWRIDNNGGNFRVTDILNSLTPVRIQPGADSDGLFLDSTGRVGLRTIPVADVHAIAANVLLESEASLNLTLEGATGDAESINFVQNGSTEWVLRSDGATNFVLKNGSNDNIIGIINGVTTEAIRIDSAGEVGINNVTPQRQLDVDGTGRFSGQLDIGDSGNAQPALNFNRAGTDEWLVYSASTSGHFVIANIDSSLFPFIINNDAANALVTLHADGVGINDTAPTRDLDVTGTGHFTGLLEADGGIDINGNLVNSMGVSTLGATGEITTEDLVACTTGGITVTLPVAATAGAGKVVYIKDRDGNASGDNITIEGNGSETIDGSLTFVMNVNYQSVTLVTDGSNWMIV